jgi:small subunit ribosomal protein S6
MKPKGQNMPFYETVFIARQDLSAQQVESLTTQLTDIVKAQGGKISKTEQWGLRSFAYKINKAKKGHYVLIETDCAPAALHEMERNIRLNEDVVRHLTIRLDEATDGPSAIIDNNRQDFDVFNEEAA